jgi:hypothetical protein
MSAHPEAYGDLGTDHHAFVPGGGTRGKEGERGAAPLEQRLAMVLERLEVRIQNAQRRSSPAAILRRFDDVDDEETW